MAVVSEDIDSLGTTLTALEGGLVFHTHCPVHNFYIWGLCMDTHELGSPESYFEPSKCLAVQVHFLSIP